MGNLERAKITPLNPDGSPLGESVDVCFNPKEYSLDKSLNWKSKDAKYDAPEAEFNEPTPMVLSVTLQFDTFEWGVSVRDQFVKKIEKMTLLRGDPKGNKLDYQPPLVLFVWGQLNFQGVIESMSQKYTMALRDVTPVRAEVSLKIKQAGTSKGADWQSSIDGSGSGDGQARAYSVQQGDRIDNIAKATLGDPARWTEIAEANDIDDPKKLPNKIKY